VIKGVGPHTFTHEQLHTFGLQHAVLGNVQTGAITEEYGGNGIMGFNNLPILGAAQTYLAGFADDVTFVELDSLFLNNSNTDITIPEKSTYCLLLYLGIILNTDDTYGNQVHPLPILAISYRTGFVYVEVIMPEFSRSLLLEDRRLFQVAKLAVNAEYVFNPRYLSLFPFVSFNSQAWFPGGERSPLATPLGFPANRNMTNNLKVRCVNTANGNAIIRLSGVS
jgi:hypothetical protein